MCIMNRGTQRDGRIYLLMFEPDRKYSIVVILQAAVPIPAGRNQDPISDERHPTAVQHFDIIYYSISRLY